MDKWARPFSYPSQLVEDKLSHNYNNQNKKQNIWQCDVISQIHYNN